MMVKWPPERDQPASREPHGFGMNAIPKGVPLNMLSKWMGHATLEVTAIYANALGEEQRSIAARMWNGI